jgi:hypothetical protein
VLSANVCKDLFGACGGGYIFSHDWSFGGNLTFDGGKKRKKEKRKKLKITQQSFCSCSCPEFIILTFGAIGSVGGVSQS